MNTLVLLFVEIKRMLVLQMRYPMDFIVGLFLLSFLFYGLLAGAEFITGAESFNQNLDGIIVGYSVWMVLYSGMNFIPGTIQGEAARGTLEAVFLSYVSVDKIFLLRSIAESIVSVLFTAIILLVLLWLTERSLSFSMAILIPTATTVIAAIGVGFLIGGFALEYKQVGQVVVLAQYPLLFLMMTPFEKMESFIMQCSMFLPVVPSAITLRQIMISDVPFLESYYIIAIANGVIYLLLGMWAFSVFSKRVRMKGLLAGY
jgi:ABC-2 type transport system permease protein